MDAIHARYQQLEEKVRASNPHADTTRLRAAFEYANAHHGQPVSYTHLDVYKRQTSLFAV